jgi:hypothetical protein
LSWRGSGYLDPEKHMRPHRILTSNKARVTQFGVSIVSKSIKLRIAVRRTTLPTRSARCVS